MKKHIFFDIDGTILSNENIIPEKTKYALAKLKENGHSIYICTGRTKGYVFDPRIRNLGFDGYVYGCGTMLEYKDRILYEYRLDDETIKKTGKVILDYDIYAVYEGRDKMYMSFENELFHLTHKTRLEAISKLHTQVAYAHKLKDDLGDRLADIRLSYPDIDASKVSVYINSKEAREEFFKSCAGVLDPISRGEEVHEMVPVGHSKGNGILELCKYIGVDKSDTISFGDSNNDADMFEKTNLSICMGNGSDGAKAKAKYITTGIEDGIYDACVHFGLI